ncbi:hypothetical protein YC2023_005241 [Brassica napus]
MENPPPARPSQTGVTSSMQHIPQRIHQLHEGISVRPITRQLLEGRLTGNIQPNDPKNLTEGDIHEFSGFSVIHNSRHRTLTQLPYYIQIDQKTIALNVTLNGPIFRVHNLSPQNYRNPLRLATTPTYLPGKSTIVKLILCDKQATNFSILQNKKDMKFKVAIITSIIPKLFQGKLLLRSSPATNFYFNKSIDYIKQFKR